MRNTSRPHRFVAIVAALGIVSLAGCDWRSEAERDAMANESSAPNEATSPAAEIAEDAADMTMDSQTFVEMAALEGLLEVRLGELASRQAGSQAVNDLARDLVTDHRAANAELERLADTLELPVPRELPADKQSTLDRLAGLSGADFDREYAHTMVVGHRSAIELYRQVDDPTMAPELESFAATRIATLEQHLERAEALESTG